MAPHTIPYIVHYTLYTLHCSNNVTESHSPLTLQLITHTTHIFNHTCVISFDGRMRVADFSIHFSIFCFFFLFGIQCSVFIARKAGIMTTSFSSLVYRTTVRILLSISFRCVRFFYFLKTNKFFIFFDSVRNSSNFLFFFTLGQSYGWPLSCSWGNFFLLNNFFVYTYTFHNL